MVGLRTVCGFYLLSFILPDIFSHIASLLTENEEVTCVLMTGLEGFVLLGVTDKRFRDLYGRNNCLLYPPPTLPASLPPLFSPLWSVTVKRITFRHAGCKHRRHEAHM